MYSLDLSVAWVFLGLLLATLVIVGTTVGVAAWYTDVHIKPTKKDERDVPAKKRDKSHKAA